MTRFSLAKTVVLAVAALGLGACEAQNRASLSPDFGNATRHNIAMHVINPAPANLDRLPEHSGMRTAVATTLYHTDRVKEPEPIETTGN